jgi:hypothetical protein
MALGLSMPVEGRAQAVCSAPHSSPVLARGGTIRTLPPGAGYIQLSFLRQASDGFFDPNGDRRPWLADARLVTSSAYVTGSAGLMRGLDAWGQVPFHYLESIDQTGSRSRTGLGDLRFSLRVAPDLFGIQDVPLSLRAGVKLPGSDFPVDARIIPLGEGQRDWELSLESGTGFTVDATQGYVLAWIGYRLREENTESGFEPGDEVFGHAAMGGTWRGLRLELALDVLIGGPPTQIGLELPGAARRMVQLSPTLGYDVASGTIELTALVPLSGRNLPSGPGLSVGYRHGWGLL